jgi:hypothetical protein
MRARRAVSAESAEVAVTIIRAFPLPELRLARSQDPDGEKVIFQATLEWREKESWLPDRMPNVSVELSVCKTGWGGGASARLHPNHNTIAQTEATDALNIRTGL